MHDGVYVCRHITYIATGILTQVHAAMWVKNIPTRPRELLHGVVELYS